MKYADLAPNKQIGDFGYNHQALLGSGAFGKVYLGKILKTNQKVAIKVLENSQMSDNYLQEALKKEISIMTKLKGENVVRLLEVLRTSNHTYLIQEFCSGGDFRAYLNKKKKIQESEAILILRDLLNGFKELAGLGIVHRDLKPENILINNNVFKIADFGFATNVDNFKNAMLKTAVGTPLYMSPQILVNEQYTSKSDVWSMGLIFFESLFGKTPWPAKSQYELVENTRKIALRFPYDVKISDISKEFIKGCLKLNEKDRFSWEQVFSHEIYVGDKGIKQSIESNPGRLSSRKRKNTVNLGEKALEVLVDLQEIIIKHNINLPKVFKNFDRSGDNNLDKKEFAKLILIIKEDLKEYEIEEIFSKFDINGDGSITYEEFYSLLMETEYRKTGENELLGLYRGEKILRHLVNIIKDNRIDINRLFKRFDISGNKKLKLEEFRPIIQIIEDSVTAEDVNYVFKKFDHDQDGEISIDEFKKAVNVNVEKENVSKSLTVVQNVIQQLRDIIKSNGLSLQWVFNHYDKQGDGSLNFQEFKSFIEVFSCRYKESEIREVFNLFDANGDGDISFKEFEKYMN